MVNADPIPRSLKSSNLIYGNTMKTLTLKDNRTETQSRMLREDPKSEASFTSEKPVRFNPYPDYNSDEWKQQGHAAYVPCKGATGEFVEDLLVFKGRPRSGPRPSSAATSSLASTPTFAGSATRGWAPTA